MKKIVIIILFLLVVPINNKYISASNNHSNYQKLTLAKGKLLSDYSSKELNSYYKKVQKRKFSGWNTHTINNRVEGIFIDQTIFTYYNDGYTPIEYNYKMEETEVAKYSFSSVGSINVTTTKSGTGFKNGLDGSLKLSYSTDKSKTTKETYEIKLKIDPGTQVNLYRHGSGRLTNGVGSRYLFWIRTDTGGFEIFEISSSSIKLEKIRI